MTNHYRAPMADLKKRLLAGLLAALMVCSFAACSDDADPAEDDTPDVGS